MQKPSINTTILVVDDAPENIDVLSGLLRDEYKVQAALNGPKALDIAFSENKPDLILLDVMMPEMDGFEVCRQLKANPTTKDIPIIFVTAKGEVKDETHGFEVGAVDYISKPISPPIVKERIKTHLKIRELMTQLVKEKKAVEKINHELVNEQLVAKQIYDRFVHSGCLDDPNIKHCLEPMDIFSGDLLLASKSPLTDSYYFFLGDFTGHGLTAAIGVIPAADTFYNMTNEGYSLSKIITELHQKLKRSLPASIFCAATLMEINLQNQMISIWNGWNPEAFVIDKQCQVKHTFSSDNMPLGSIIDVDFSAEVKIHKLEEGDRVYVFSDGITETANDDEEQFDTQGILDTFNTHNNPDTLFEEILKRVKNHEGSQGRSDDITFIEFKI